MKTYYTYIVSNKSRRIYVGVTNDLPRRTFEHKHKIFKSSFTAKYNFDMLVYFECHSRPMAAIQRETQIKGWRREKKLRLILSMNPDWADLSAEWREDESWQSVPSVMPPKVFVICMVSLERGAAGSSGPALKPRRAFRNDSLKKKCQNESVWLGPAWLPLPPRYPSDAALLVPQLLRLTPRRSFRNDNLKKKSRTKARCFAPALPLRLSR